MGRRFLAPVSFAAVMAVSASAMAQPQCTDRTPLLDLLAKKYKETPVALGVTNTGGLVEVLSAAKGDTWTIIVTAPNGKSCMIAAGEGWRQLDPASLDPAT